MIKGEDILEDILKFKGFWKSSMNDKLKWLVIWLFIALFVVVNTIGIILITPFELMRKLFKRKERK